MHFFSKYTPFDGIWGMPILRLRLMFMPDVLGALFIPEAKSISESRVGSRLTDLRQ